MRRPDRFSLPQFRSLHRKLQHYPGLYRNILRDYGRANQPKLIRDAATKRKVLEMLESVVRGIDRLAAVTKRRNLTSFFLGRRRLETLTERLKATLCRSFYKSRCYHFLVWSDNAGMRRWMFMAAVTAALLATPVWGQRGGRGGVAMGGARGGVGQRGGFMGAPRGPYGGGGFHGVYGRGFNGFPPHYPSHPIHYPYYKWRYPWNWCYGGYCGYPWAWGWYGGAGGAYYSYPADSYPVYDAPPDNSGAYAAYGQQQEIDRLNDEVARLRAEQPLAAPANPARQLSAEQIADTVLVFRDGRSEAIQNYAIVGETLWVFAGQRARRIPIADLDVSATTKANEARGIDFRLPGH